MDEIKRTFFKEEIEERRLIFIKKCLENPNLKEISFYGKN
jgi:hypothetical protein